MGNSTLRLVIGHSHLQPGGVTTVIRCTLRTLAERHPEVAVVVVSGREPPENFSREHRVPVVVLPELDYPEREPRNRSELLLPQLVQEVRRAFGGSPADVWHWHNPALGKNASTLSLVNALAREGESVLFQHHDLAERRRPANFRLREHFRLPADAAFPVAPRVHHAFINRRDLELVVAAGLPTERCSILRNPVAGSNAPVSVGAIANRQPEAFWLYPVRATARKNLGEFLFYGYAEKKRRRGVRLAQSLPPTNPEYLPEWQRWKKLAAELQLPVILGLGEQVCWSFAETLQRSLGTLTTSIEEGFGMALLEPWLHGRWVAGRDLPELTGDLRTQGFLLPDLRPTLPVPTAFFDFSAFWKRRSAARRAAYVAYGLAEALSSEARPFPRAGELWDFGALDATAQEEILSAPNIPPEFWPDLPTSEALQNSAAQETIARNQTLAAELYAPARTTLEALLLWQQLADAPVQPLVQTVDNRALLLACLQEEGAEL